MAAFWVILGQNWYFDFCCETVTVISFKRGKLKTLNDFYILITLFCDLNQCDWILGHFGSKLIFCLLLWNGDSCLIQTWHKASSKICKMKNAFVITIKISFGQLSNLFISMEIFCIDVTSIWNTYKYMYHNYVCM